MMFIRPVRGSDREALLDLGRAAGHGMTTVPKSPEQINHRIDQSARAFSSKGKANADHIFYMVLEEDGEVVGTCCIFPNLGEKRPFYSYRLAHLSAQDQKRNIRSETDILMLVNDYHGYTEIGTLFLLPEKRGGGRGRLLSFARFMLMAIDKARFGDQVMAEIRGWSGDDGIFPFYEHIAQKFFQISFLEADKRSAHDHQFIADLMPKYPVYTDLLPQKAIDVIGKPHASSKPAMDLLIDQGFRYHKLIDIFDGGPSIEAPIDDIKTIRLAQIRKVEIGTPPKDGAKAIISTTDMTNFVCMQTMMEPQGDTLILTQQQADIMNLAQGDDILVSPLFSKSK